MSNHFHSFIQFITPMEFDSHACACILGAMSIVLYALTLYTTATAYIIHQHTHDTTDIVDTHVIRTTFQECIVAHQPYVPKQAIEKIVAVSDELVKQSLTLLPKKLTIHGPQTPHEIGQELCETMDKLYSYLM